LKKQHRHSPEEVEADTLESLYEAAQTEAEPEGIMENAQAEESLRRLPVTAATFDTPETAASKKQEAPHIGSTGSKKTASRKRAEKNAHNNPIEER
jgi:hypothetical protein